MRTAIERVNSSKSLRPDKGPAGSEAGNGARHRQGDSKVSAEPAGDAGCRCKYGTTP